MGEIPMNYRAVVDTFAPDGSLYGSVFCDLGMDLSDEFYDDCEKAQSEMTLALTKDFMDLSAEDFGSYVKGLVEYLRESFSACQYYTFDEAPSLIMLYYMNIMCSEDVDSSFKSKVIDGFNTMFSAFPMNGVPEFCFCVQTAVDYINFSDNLNCLNIDAVSAVENLLHLGDTLYSNELFKKVGSDEGITWYENPGPRDDIMKTLEYLKGANMCS